MQRVLILLCATALVTLSANTVESHHVTGSDGRLVQPYALTVITHVPVAAGYEPVPTPQHCLEGATVTDTFYSQNFESGTHGYTKTGTSLAPGTTNQWSVTSYAGGGSDTGHSDDMRLYFGNPTTGTYGTGATDGTDHTAGVMQSPDITIPNVDGTVYLGFATKWQVEWLKGYDHLWVEMQDTTPTTGRIHLLCTSNAYDRADPSGGGGQTVIPSCSPYHFNPCPLDPLTGEVAIPWGWEQRWVQVPDSLQGKTVKVRFTFDSSDDKANPYMGWMVDDVVLGTELDPIAV